MSETPKSYPPCIPILMETVLCWYHDTLPRLPFSALNLLSSNETIYNKFSLFSLPFPLYKCYFHVGVVVHVVILMQYNLIWYTSELVGTPLKKFIHLKFTYLSLSNWLLRPWGYDIFYSWKYGTHQKSCSQERLVKWKEGYLTWKVFFFFFWCRWREA